MKAAVVRAFGVPLVIEDRPDPQPGPGQVRVRIEASGLCHTDIHTDIHAAHGDWPVKPNPPFGPGHEGVDLVEKLGDGVPHPQQINTGYGCDGGYAENMPLWAEIVFDLGAGR